jgi:hypothetical protein
MVYKSSGCPAVRTLAFILRRHSGLAFACICLCLNLLKAQVVPLPGLVQWRIDGDSPPWNIPAPCWIPGSVAILQATNHQPVSPEHYTVSGSTIVWLGDTARIPFPLVVRYRICPEWLSKPIVLGNRPTPAAVEADSGGRFLYKPYAEQAPLVNFQKLDYSGRFSRGIAVGNRQDLSLQSGFNLQLSGDLGDGIALQAAISDEHLPLQPEGSSLQLRDFDRVYVHLKRRGDEFTAGDFDLQNGESYFLRFVNRLQGVQIGHKSSNGHQQAGLAVNRGRFARYVLSVQEGNQGPYPLQGAAGERFIVLLAGTERVWLNGELLQRGFDHDYTIDYNRGELTFMPRRRMSRETRITVEYEYADQNFLRSIYTFRTEHTWKRMRLYAQAYSRQDSRSPTSSLLLSEKDRETLYQAGDDPAKALISGLQAQDQFTPSRVYYFVKDTLSACGKTDSALFFTQDPERARFTARFTYLGPGKGNYKLYEQPLANERVFYWVAPDPTDCRPTGEYEPVLQLTPPQQQQMLVAGQEWAIGPQTSLRSEFALSRMDPNRLSPLEKKDDLGAAAFLEIKQQAQLGKDSSAWKVNGALSFEGLHRNFRTLNPYRSPEFLRDWSLADFQGKGSPPATYEYLSHLDLSLEQPRTGQISYQAQSFLRPTSYQGLKQGVRWTLQPKNWDIRGNIRQLQARTTSESLLFWQPWIEVRTRLSQKEKWEMSWQSQGEYNARRLFQNTSLQPGSFAFYLLRGGLKSPAEKPWGWNMDLQYREDLLPLSGTWARASIAREASLSGYWQKKTTSRLHGTLSYRQFQSDALLLPELNSRNTLLGRIDASFQVFKGSFRSQATLETGAGQEPRQEYTFIKVAPGEGTYIWLDSLYNADGVIQPVEMQPAPFPDQADYIRVPTISTRYVQTDYLNLSQHLQFEPGNFWEKTDSGTVPSLVRRLSGQLSWRTQQKKQGGSPFAILQPDVADTSLVALNEGLRQSLTFNRAHPKWEIQWVRTLNRSKQVQTSGYDIRELRESYGLLRWNPFQTWSLKAQAGSGIRKSLVTSLNGQDYTLPFQKIEGDLSWLPRPGLRAQIHFRIQSERNTVPGQNQQALLREIRTESAYTPGNNTTLTVRLAWIAARFEGDARSPAGFAILNGLQPGINWIWNLGMERQLNRALQLRVQYDGRKTGKAPPAHIGRVQVTALF